MNVSRIDHEWLRRHVSWSLTGAEPIGVESISHSGGVMGTVHRITCGGWSAVFKGPPNDPTALNGLVPGTDLLGREVQSYRFLAARGPTASRVAPECWWSALGPDGLAALVLEDLGATDPLPGVMASGFGRDQATAAVRCLAIVHASLAMTTSDALTSPYPWLFSASSPGLAAWIRLGIDDLPRVLASRWPAWRHGQALDRVRSIDVEALIRRSHVGANCVAFCHGDAWAGNALWRSGEDATQRTEAVLIDWQYAMWGNPLSDVALLLLSSLTPAARDAWEETLLAQYHETLIAHCELDYTLGACREDLQRAEPFAAVVALATLEAYTEGMRPEELARYAATARTALDRAGISVPSAGRERSTR